VFLRRPGAVPPAFSRRVGVLNPPARLAASTSTLGVVEGAPKRLA